MSLFLIVPDWNVSGDIRRRASAIIQPEILLLSKRPVSWIESHLTHLCRLDWNWNPSWNSEMWPFNPPQRRISHLSATASRERILKNPPKNLWLGWVMEGLGGGGRGGALNVGGCCDRCNRTISQSEFRRVWKRLAKDWSQSLDRPRENLISREHFHQLSMIILNGIPASPKSSVAMAYRIAAGNGGTR